MLLTWVIILVFSSASVRAELSVPGPKTAVPVNSMQDRTAESQIPKKTTAPPSLFQRQAPETFRCQRTFVYEGRVLGCDSNVRRDGEMLRPIIRTVPEAVNELNLYQKNRATLQQTAYFGTTGLLLLLAGAVGGGGLGKQLMLFGGGGILSGSLLYGFLSLRANEEHLGNAVDFYNRAHPEHPIRLEFTTHIDL